MEEGGREGWRKEVWIRLIAYASVWCGTSVIDTAVQVSHKNKVLEPTSYTHTYGTCKFAAHMMCVATLTQCYYTIGVSIK